MQDPDFVEVTSHQGVLCPHSQSKPAQFNRDIVKWVFEQLHKTFFKLKTPPVKRVYQGNGSCYECHPFLSMSIMSLKCMSRIAIQLFLLCPNG